MMLRRGNAGVMGDSATGETSSRASCEVRASKGTRKSGDGAVPKMSSGSRSRYPVRGMVCQPQEMKGSEGCEPSYTGIILTM